MIHRITALVSALWVACAMMSCGGIVADGGQSGTGISAIRGNVVAAAGTSLDVAGIRVILTEPDLETETDAAGRFELSGNASGPAELRFERERDGLSAATDVVIPAGGVLELTDIVLDPESDEAHPTLRRVEFEGFVAALDCAGGAIVVTAKEDEDGTVFTVETASATIRHDAVPLQCSDLRVGDRVQIDAETPDGLMLVNAEVVLEDREDQPGDDASDDGKGDPESDDGAVDQPGGDNGDEAENEEEVDQPGGDNGDEAENEAGVDEPDGDNGDEAEN